MAYSVADVQDIIGLDEANQLLMIERDKIYTPRSVCNSFQVIPIPNGTPAALARKIHRINGQGSLFYFSTVILHKTKLQRTKDLHKNLHYQMCKVVEKDGLQEVIEIPRDHYKSSVYSECLPMWRTLPFTDSDELIFRSLGYGDEFILWMRRAHRQDYRWLLVSEVTKNAAKLGTRISAHYESNSDFKEIYPEIIPDSSNTWNNLSLTHKRTKDGVGHGEGTYDFIGVGGALQSTHYDGCIQDDLVGRAAFESPSILEDTIEYHKLLVGAMDSDTENGLRENDEVIVGNRWAYNDLNSYIRANEDYFLFTTHSALGGCCPIHPYGTPIFPEAFSLEKLEKFKKRLGNYLFSCFPENAPILMYDFSEKKISELKVGDYIVGYKTNTGYASLTHAKVEYINIKQADIYEYVIWDSDGTTRTVRCTEDHKFFNVEHRDRELYAPLKVGKKVVSVYKPFDAPSNEEQRDFDWLGGILDGEGSCTQTNVFICQSLTANPIVWQAIKDTLVRLKIDFNFEKTSDQFVLSGGRSLVIKLLKYARMYKKDRFRDRIWKRRGRVAENGGRDSIVLSKKFVETATVYNIQSSTGNYVAYGLATKNCQFLNVPINPAEIKFKKSDLRYYELVADNSEALTTKKRRVKIRHHVREGDVIPDVFPRTLTRYMCVDPNHSGNEGRCRHAITVTGVHENPRREYLLDVWAKACGIDEFIEVMFNLAFAWKINEIHLETIAAQKYLKYHLDYRIDQARYSSKDVDSWIQHVKIVELKTPKTKNAKQMRIDSLGPIIERHELWVNSHGQNEFMEELETYPNGQLRDVLDTLGYMPGIWNFDGDTEDIEAEILKRKARYIRNTSVNRNN